MPNIFTSSAVDTFMQSADTAAMRTNTGLGNVNNTSDAAKPVSTAQATADALVASNAASALAAHTGNTSNPHSTTKTQVGLGNVDNTTDAGKPISTATQAALDLKAPKASPAFTGTPTAPTPSSGDNSTKLATTAFVSTAASTAGVNFSSAADAAARRALTRKSGDIVQQADTLHRWLACDVAALATDFGWQDLGIIPLPLFFTMTMSPDVAAVTATVLMDGPSSFPCAVQWWDGETQAVTADDTAYAHTADTGSSPTLKFYGNYQSIDATLDGVTTATVTNESSLSVLFIGGSSLTSVEVGGLSSLQQLNVSGANLATVNFHDLPALINVDFGNSAVTSIDVTGLPSVTGVFASNCPNLNSVNLGDAALTQTVYLNNTALSAEVKGAILELLDAAGVSNGIVNLAGDGTYPSGSDIPATIASLESRGWNVTLPA